MKNDWYNYFDVGKNENCKRWQNSDVDEWFEFVKYVLSSSVMLI